MLKYICTIYSIFILSSYTNELTAFRAKTEKTFEAPIVVHHSKMTKLNQNYISSLKALLKRVQSQGILESTSSTLKELKRFEKELTVTEDLSEIESLKKLQKNYLKTALIYEKELAKKIMTIASKYDTTLERYQKKLVIKGHLDQAEEVQKERTSFKKHPIVKRLNIVLSSNQVSRPVKTINHERRDLLLYYNFNDNESKDIFDQSSKKNHGKPTNIKFSQHENLGLAAQFGHDTYIDVKGLKLNKDFTISFLVNLKSTRNGQCFLGKHTEGGGNIFLFGIWNDGYHLLMPGGEFEKGKVKEGWQHLVVVGDAKGSSTTVKVYRDEELLWMREFPNTLNYTKGKPWTIGQDWDDQRRSDFIDGEMDELLIYRKAIKESDIKKLFNIYK